MTRFVRPPDSDPAVAGGVARDPWRQLWASPSSSFISSVTNPSGDQHGEPEIPNANKAQVNKLESSCRTFGLVVLLVFRYMLVGLTGGAWPVRSCRTWHPYLSPES